MPLTIRRALENLFPGYFALVMATGIVSLAAQTQTYTSIAHGLFYLNILFYVLLVALYVLRFLWAWPRVAADLANPAVCPAFLTAVAGTSVLGIQFQVLQSHFFIACLLWCVSILLWLVICYWFFTIVIIRRQKSGLQAELSGIWLLIVVSTQSLAVLGILLAPEFEAQRELVAFGALCFYLLGCLFYLIVINLILYRLLFLPLEPAELNPAYWINMGAIAITTMAGARLVQARDFALLIDLQPFLKGSTLFFWAACCWWIPLLLILGFWRHGIRRFPLTYHPSYWSMVFPLGMFTAATFQLARALQLPFLEVIPTIFFPIALVAWVVVFAGLITQIVPQWRQGE